jgi:hypothetical protein
MDAANQSAQARSKEIMINKMSFTTYVLIAILLVALFFGVYSFGIPNVKARVVPLMATSLVFILAAIELIREIRISRGKKEGSIQKEQGGETDITDERRRLFAVFGWMFGFFVAIYIIGFPISVFLFILLFLKLHDRGWTTAIISAVVTAGLIYLVFVVFLKTPLFQGIVFEGFSIEHWIQSGRKSL